MFFNEAFAGSVPLPGTDVAAQWDSLYSFLVWLSVFFFILVVGAMLYFNIKYRYRPGMKTKYITGHHLLEAVWIAIPTLLLLVIFAWGYSVYHSMTEAPSDAYEVRVIGKQWLWTFQYDTGRTTIGELYVPMNKPVKLIMTSEDVLHSFFIPNFRVKQDVIPGMYSSVWFTATVPGKHQVYCAEYCGTSHSEMLAKVIVLDDDQWDAWTNNKKLGNIPEAGQEVSKADDEIRTSAASRQVAQANTGLEAQGKELFHSKSCTVCHSTDGTTKVGPSLKGVYGKEIELDDGRKVVVADSFIQAKIMDPQKNTIKGYKEGTSPMPTFKGQISATEVNALIAYIKSLK
jgi:cytochrome c oxidase subunit 2